MKALVCTACVDIRAIAARLDRDEWDQCSCGRVRARWIDPIRGTVQVDDPTRRTARVMGIHNGFLRLMVAEPALSNDAWRDAVQQLVNDADGYLFHESKRACPVVLIRVGESSDTFWYQPPAEPIELEGEAAERAAEILRRRGRLDEEPAT